MRDFQPLGQHRAIAKDLADSDQLAWTIARAAEDRKAGDIILLDVREVSYLADYFVIATGYSRTQVRAISDAIEAEVAKQFGQHPVRVEGKEDGSWVLLDFGDAIAHIMLPEERDYYGIEAFWGHAKRIEYESAPAKAN